VVSLDFSVTCSFRPTMALESTQPLVKTSTRKFPACKGGRCVRLTTLPPSCAECHENLGAQNSWNLSRPHGAGYGTPLPLQKNKYVLRLTQLCLSLFYYYSLIGY